MHLGKLEGVSRWVGCLFFVSVGVGAVACSADSAKGTHGNSSGGAAVSGSAGSGSAGLGGNSGIGGGSTIMTAAGTGGGTNTGVCSGLQCQVHTCSGGTTTISGKVYDPAGKNPLYNIVVYVPNEPVKPFKSGASCDACNDLYSGKPVAVALTDGSGAFVIKNAPDGPNIPLVIQVGKWRMQKTLANVVQCKDNPQPDKSLRLPKNQMEGDIPNIAISTGGADTLECLLARVGVDKAEYAPGPASQGRIHIFQGGGSFTIPFFGTTIGAPNTNPAAPTSAAALWKDTPTLMAYDIVLLSCEGSETSMMNQQALHDYASAGGRVFASHFHYAWFNTGPYGTENLATWSAGGNTIGDLNGDIVTTLPNGMPFPKGVALKQWLGNVGALNNGLLPIQAARHNADVAAMNTPSQPWIIADKASSAAGATQYFSFNTPTNPMPMPDGRPGVCGRVVFSDLHVGAASGDMQGMTVPDECADADLSPQEKALEFMLFDLSSCVTPDNAPPAPPLVQ